MTFGNPGIPDRIHLCEIGHIPEPDFGLEHVFIVGSGFFQEGVNLGDAFTGLIGNGITCADLAAEIDNAVVADDFAHPLSGVHAVNHRGGNPCIVRVCKSARNIARHIGKSTSEGAVA